MTVTVSLALPVDLIAAQVECERLAYPTGAEIFASGERAAAIFGVLQGLVELIDRNGMNFRISRKFKHLPIVCFGEDKDDRDVQLCRKLQATLFYCSKL